jgi:cytochrome c peroxidase
LLSFTAWSEDKPQVLAPGYGPLQFDAPSPGTYQLPPLFAAPDGAVLDSAGTRRRLHDLTGDKLVLMGFIYTHCPDVNGCPLASFVMKKVQAQLLVDKNLASQVRLLSLSFDPEMDTPQALRDYAQHFRRKDFDWQFLTTASDKDLLPILQGYGQFRVKNYNQQGQYAGSMSHILRVFLIDRQRRIRNIYSTGFLHADTVLNDLRTLAMEGS